MGMAAMNPSGGGSSFNIPFSGGSPQFSGGGKGVGGPAAVPGSTSMPAISAPATPTTPVAPQSSPSTPAAPSYSGMAGYVDPSGKFVAAQGQNSGSGYTSGGNGYFTPDGTFVPISQ